MTFSRIALFVAVTLAGSAGSVLAQPVGTFHWQIQPYCNVLTLTVTNNGGVYTLDGTDDLCGAPRAASVAGIAFLNPDGTIGLGVTSVLPGGTPMHLEATIGEQSLGGSWRDSAGNSGSLVLAPQQGGGGTPRPPAPWVSVPPGSITAVQLANGAVGSAAIAPNAITGPHIADGSITGAKLATGAVGPAAISADSVVGSHVVDGSLTRRDMADAPSVAVDEGLTFLNLPADQQTVVAQLTVNPPANGQVIVNTSGTLFMGDLSSVESVRCSITPGTAATAPFAALATEAGVNSYRFLPFGGTRTFSVGAGFPATIRLVCNTSQSTIWILYPVLNALFVAEP